MVKSKNDDKDVKKMQEGIDIPEVSEGQEVHDEPYVCAVDFEKQNQEITECYQRLAAEYENYRKRSVKEKEEIYDTCVVDITDKFLPVLDNLDLALANSKSAKDEVQKGIVMIHKQFMDTLAKLDVKEIDCLNKQFDPNLHDAVMTVDDPEKQSGVIADVFKKGYIYKERVVRHCMVKVVK